VTLSLLILLIIIHEKNDFDDKSKNLDRIFWDHQNNYVGDSSMISNTVKKFWRSSN